MKIEVELVLGTLYYSSQKHTHKPFKHKNLIYNTTMPYTRQTNAQRGGRGGRGRGRGRGRGGIRQRCFFFCGKK